MGIGKNIMPKLLYIFLRYLWVYSIVFLMFFIYFALGLLFGFVLLLMNPFILNRNRKIFARRIQFVNHVFFKALTKTLVSMRIIKVSFFQKENTKKLSRTLIICNHLTYLDVVLLIGMFPHCDCLIKSSLYNNIFWGQAVQAAGYIANKGKQYTLDAMITRIKTGHNVLLFPEGTRRKKTDQLKFNRGFARLIHKTQCDVLPIYMDCSPTFLTKDKLIFHLPFHAPHYKYIFGKIKKTNFTKTCVSSDAIMARRITKYWEGKYKSTLSEKF